MGLVVLVIGWRLPSATVQGQVVFRVLSLPGDRDPPGLLLPRLLHTGIVVAAILICLLLMARAGGRRRVVPAAVLAGIALVEASYSLGTLFTPGEGPDSLFRQHRVGPAVALAGAAVLMVAGTVAILRRHADDRALAGPNGGDSLGRNVDPSAGGSDG